MLASGGKSKNTDKHTGQYKNKPLAYIGEGDYLYSFTKDGLPTDLPRDIPSQVGIRNGTRLDCARLQIIVNPIKHTVRENRCARAHKDWEGDPAKQDESGPIKPSDVGCQPQGL